MTEPCECFKFNQAKGYTPCFRCIDWLNICWDMTNFKLRSNMTKAERDKLDCEYFAFLCAKVSIQDDIFDREPHKHYVMDGYALRECACKELYNDVYFYRDFNGFKIHRVSLAYGRS